MEATNKKNTMYLMEYDFNGRRTGLMVSDRTAHVYVEDLNLEDGLAGLNEVADKYLKHYVDIGEFCDGKDGCSAAVTLNIPGKEEGTLEKKTLGYLSKRYEPFLNLSSDGYRVGIINDWQLENEDEHYDEHYIVLLVPMDLANLNSHTAKGINFYDLPEGYWNSREDQVLIGWREFYNQVLRQTWSD